jgi:glycosyltransferase involved in cell wall biosynthesis
MWGSSGAFSLINVADRPLRIRYEHTRYPHWGQRSGYVQLAHHLDPSAFRVGVHATPDDDSDLPSWLDPLRPALKALCRRSGMRWYKVSDLTAEARIFRECLRDAWDVVHFLDGEHSGRFLPGLLRWRGRSGPRVVATYHQPPDIARTIIDGKALRRLDQVIVVSPTQVEFFGRHVPEDRLHVVLHGIDTSFFRPAEVAPANSRPVCVTVGNWLRDWATVEAVARALPEMDFEIVTSAKLAIDLPNVRIRSGLGDDTLGALYRSADILFLPLLGATANNALLEGIASGLPVITTDLAAVRAYVPGPEAILLPVGTEEPYIDALRRLAGDDVLRATMARRARARAEELSWERIAKVHEAIYRQAVERPTR